MHSKHIKFIDSIYLFLLFIIYYLKLGLFYLLKIKP